MTIILDLETNGLWPNVTKIWCAVAYDTELNKVVAKFGPKNYDYPSECVGDDCLASIEHLPGWLNRYAPELSCHNGVGFDLKVLKSLLGFEYRGVYFDTLLASRILWPDREGGHSVEAWAKSFGMHKPEHEDWTQFSEEMLYRCVEDVKIQAKLYSHIQDHIKTLQEDDPRIDFDKVFRMEHKVWEIMERQHDYGWRIDLDHAFKTKDIIEKEYNDLREQLVNVLPKRIIRPSIKNKSEVTKAFREDGEETSASLAWFKDICSIKPVMNYIPEVMGDFCKVKFEPMNPGSPDQIKDYLLSQGWQPLNYNYKKDKFGKAIKDKYGKKIKTSPKMPKDEEWDTVMELTDNPQIKLVAKFYVVRHRKGLINSFIKNCDNATHRIHYDVITCGTNCVVAGTLIQTDCGLIPIEQVQKGDLVITHEGKYENCLDFINNGIKPVYRVKTDLGREIICTENHPFWTGLHFVECKHLQPGNYVSTYSNPLEWRKYSRGDYYISNTGLVQNFYGYFLGSGGCNKERRRKLYTRGRVDLNVDGKVVKKSIGNIVLETFVEARPEGKECCHRDGNPTNNHIENLYWGTSKENTADQILHGRLLKTKRESKYTILTQEDVDKIRDLYENTKLYKGFYSDVAKQFGVSRGVIGQICRNQRWTRRTETLKYRYRINFGSERIESIEYVGDLPTFDITVENDHSYVANGFVTHNTSRMQHKIVVNVPRVPKEEKVKL